jgi:hypothetical protein
VLIMARALVIAVCVLAFSLLPYGALWALAIAAWWGPTVSIRMPPKRVERPARWPRPPADPGPDVDLQELIRGTAHRLPIRSNGGRVFQ